MENQDERFKRLNAEGGCGYQGHWRYIQVQKDGEKKQVLIENGKETVQQMLAKLEDQQEKSIKSQSDSNYEKKNIKYQAIVNGKEKEEMKLQQNLSMSQVIDLGIQKIQIKPLSQKVYPDLPPLNQNYFNNWKKQAQQKQSLEALNLKIIYQDKVLHLKLLKKEKVQILKQKISQFFKIQKDQMKVTYEKKSLEFDDKPLKYYHLEENSELQVVKIQSIIGENSIIKIQSLEEKKQTLQIKFKNSMLIEEIKKNIEEHLKIPLNQIKLFKENVQLINQKSVKDYGIQKGSTLLLKYTDKILKSSILSQVIKMVEIRTLQKQIIKFPYNLISDKSVQEVIALINTKNRPYFCLLYGKLLLKPDDIINIIQKQFVFKSSATIINMIIIASAQKSLFYSQMIDSFSGIFQFEQKQQLSKREANKKAIANYRNNNYNNQINEYIFNFKPGNKKQKYSKTAEKLKETLNVFMKMENYQSTTSQNHKVFKTPVMPYDCVKRQRYDRFNERHKIGDCFYWREFTSTVLSSESVQLQKEGMYETIYLIRSMTGKQIGKANKIDGPEVVFLPFTYFIVDHIVVDPQQQPQVQIVYLSQMPTPYTLDKSIVLMVDDIPISNQLIMKKIMEENSQVQILQLWNTKTLQIWMSQFNWIFNWAQLKLKVTTDMRRVQVDYTCKNSQLKKKNKQTYVKFINQEYAGVILIENLHKISGYTVPTFVFCKYIEEAQKKLQQKGIFGKIYYQLSNKANAMQQFGARTD